MSLELALGVSLGYIFAFSTGYYIARLGSKTKKEKPKKPFICPHGNVATLKPYMVEGQKRVLCDYCAKKEGVFSDDLPEL